MLKALTLVAALMALTITDARASEVIFKTDGNGNARTVSFETEGPWLLAWRVNSNFRSQSGFELNLINADTGFFDSRILLMRGKAGNGLKLFENEGRFQFEVVSNYADWYLTVEQLTEEEAEAYRATAN